MRLLRREEEDRLEETEITAGITIRRLELDGVDCDDIAAFELVIMS